LCFGFQVNDACSLVLATRLDDINLLLKQTQVTLFINIIKMENSNNYKQVRSIVRGSYDYLLNVDRFPELIEVSTYPMSSISTLTKKKWQLGLVGFLHLAKDFEKGEEKLIEGHNILAEVLETHIGVHSIIEREFVPNENLFETLFNHPERLEKMMMEIHRIEKLVRDKERLPEALEDLIRRTEVATAWYSRKEFLRRMVLETTPTRSESEP